jgi:hypothetical protein
VRLAGWLASLLMLSAALPARWFPVVRAGQMGWRVLTVFAGGAVHQHRGGRRRRRGEMLQDGAERCVRVRWLGGGAEDGVVRPHESLCSVVRLGLGWGGISSWRWRCMPSSWLNKKKKG